MSFLESSCDISGRFFGGEVLGVSSCGRLLGVVASGLLGRLPRLLRDSLGVASRVVGRLLGGSWEICLEGGSCGRLSRRLWGSFGKLLGLVNENALNSLQFWRPGAAILIAFCNPEHRELQSLRLFCNFEARRWQPLQRFAILKLWSGNPVNSLQFRGGNPMQFFTILRLACDIPFNVLQF